MFPRHSLVSILSCALLVALCFLSSACSSKQTGPITEQQVRAFLEEMDKAANKRDVDAVIDAMSEDVELKMTIEGFGPTQIVTLNRNQYRDYSKQALGAVRDYDYRRGETVIKIESDGQSAFVADETFETMTIGGRTIKTVSRGTSILKLENGKLVIARSEVFARPQQSLNKARPAGF
jgi:ketosteroid isomerase-like protein